MSDQVSSEATNEQILQLAAALRDMIRLVQKLSSPETSAMPPLAGLVEEFMDFGLAETARHIIALPGDFRLNGAGLTISHTNGKYEVGGDQYSLYPIVGPLLNKVLVDNSIHRSPETFEGPPIVMGKVYANREDMSDPRKAFRARPLRSLEQMEAFMSDYGGNYFTFETPEGGHLNFLTAKHMLWEKTHRKD